MCNDYLKRFPIASNELPSRLRALFQPVSKNPLTRVEVATRYDVDQYGPDREYVHMVMAMAADPGIALAEVKNTSGDGVVSFSVPDVTQRGDLSGFNPSASGLDYIVASSGNGSFYSYNLAEKVWMTLGLSPRCLGADLQQVVYDDLALPAFGVAEGEVSTEYHYYPKRNVRWLISNEYLRRYLWMHGAYGVRIFFYEALLPDSPSLRAVMAGQSHIKLEPAGDWLCSPSYRGQWAFLECRRVGRNILKVPMRELYKPKPDREILHAHAHALDPADVAQYDSFEEHVVSKTQRLVDELLNLSDRLEYLADEIGVSKPTDPVFGFRRAELKANGWVNHPEIRRLGQVSPLNMTEQAFLARGKSLHELWQRIPNGFLRQLVARAGHTRAAIKDLGSLKLLQALSNILERLNANAEEVDAFSTDAQTDDLTARNPAVSPLFVNNDLRIVDAHGAGDVPQALVALGFDIAALKEGYGRAMDHVFDKVIDAFSHVNAELSALLHRAP